MGVGHYENFPVASLLCPPRLRAPVRAIYAFARTADDIADEGDAPARQRLAELARYRSALQAATDEQRAAELQMQWSAVFDPLSAALRQHALAPSLLHALLDAFEQDVRNPPYPDRAALLAYCSRSANPIGRLLLQLYGVADEASLRQSDAVCSALQLINFWQDLSVDLPRGRNYVPMADAQRHRVSWSERARMPDTPDARALVRELVHWSASLMAEGAALAPRIPGRAGWELRLVVHGGWRVLEKIARMDYASMSGRPRLDATDVPLLLWRCARYSSAWFTALRLP
ncbi:MAG: squalene synthase HpnC [Burkholderiaceae bacterium]|nr:squalene synthase HpnC [Burkholderiaceae bacterium]